MAAVFTTSASQPPLAALAALEHAKAKVNVEVKAGSKTSLAVGTATLSGASSAARYFARAGAPALLGSDYHQQAEVSQWIESAQNTTSATAAQLAKRVNEHLQARTYLVGQSITLADLFVFYAVGSVDATLANTTRWYATIAADSGVSKVKSTPAAVATPAPAPAPAAAPSGDAQKLADAITEQGNVVRELKSAKPADKAKVDAAVAQLLALKDQYKKLTGTDAPAAAAPRAEKPKEAKPAAEAKPKEAKPAQAPKAKPTAAEPADGSDDSKKVCRLGLEASREQDLAEWYSQVITKADMIEYYDVSD